MLSTDKIIVAEGKYDKIKLSAVIDGVIVTTDGFGIFKNKEKLALLREYSKDRGIVIITDSDRAGFLIRNFLKGALGENADITNIFIPDIYGKERRKKEPSKEGKLGVEGMDNALLEDIISKGLESASKPRRNEIDKALLFELGLTGGADSSERRRELLAAMGLPGRLSANSLLDLLNAKFTKDEFIEYLNKIQDCL